jgi:iron only hydrogenase large subunit-like protein
MTAAKSGNGQKIIGETNDLKAEKKAALVELFVTLPSSFSLS